MSPHQECGGAEGAPVREFFTAMSPTQGCATALILATDPNMQNSQVAEWATQCLFRYGATVPNAHMVSVICTLEMLFNNVFWVT